MSSRHRTYLLTIVSFILVLSGCSKEEAHKGPSAQIHDAAWYVAHPDDLLSDEKKCAGDAATISREACQNVYSAESAVEENKMRDAAAHNGAATITHPKK